MNSIISSGRQKSFMTRELDHTDVKERWNPAPERRDARVSVFQRDLDKNKLLLRNKSDLPPGNPRHTRREAAKTIYHLILTFSCKEKG